jgi:chemotaxis protein MotB
MADDTQRPIVIKRIKKAHAGHHGGAWKIAYADFVTAMMAFFLLMWLLGSTTKGELQGVADYFSAPLKVSFAGGSGSGDSNSIISAGGQDLTRKVDLQTKRGDMSKAARPIDHKTAQSEVVRQETTKLKVLKARLEQAIETNALLRQYKEQLLIDITSEGLRLQVVDAQNRPMFDLGSAHLKPYARDILLELSKPLNEVENKISLSGHTDATAYVSGERAYSNWELSADRANASRRVLVAGGIADGKIKRVVGMASAVPFDAAEPNNPSNRRIAIMVLTKQAEESLNTVSGSRAAAAAGVDEAAKEALNAAPH